jgi:glycosyltransferase involved in cell wall biosynthesis
MKLLVITAAFPPMPAGEADHMFHLCRRLAERGLDVHVVTTRGNKVSDALPFKVYPVVRDWSWPDLFRLVRLFKRISPDAVLLKYIAWIYNDHPMITFMATVSKSLKPSAAFVTQFANIEGEPLKAMSLPTRLIRDRIARKAGLSCLDEKYGTLLRDSDRLIVLSDLHAKWLTGRLAAVRGKTLLIPPPPLLKMSAESNGTGRAHGRKRLGVGPGEFLLAYFGYVYPNKGVETLLRAFQSVARRRPEARLLIVGGFIARNFPNYQAYREQILELPKQLGIQEKVIWFGGYEWNSDDASTCLRAADAAVIPMDYGVQLNNSALAALTAHGLPVIATKGVVVEEQFMDEQNVLLCDPRSPAAMAEAIERLMTDAELARRLKAGARRFSDDWFSWDKAVTRTMTALSSLAPAL